MSNEDTRMRLRMTEAYWRDVKTALGWPDTVVADDVEMVHRMVQEIAIQEKRIQWLEGALKHSRAEGMRAAGRAWEVEQERDWLKIQNSQLEEDNRKLEKALKLQKDQNKMLMEGRRGI